MKKFFLSLTILIIGVSLLFGACTPEATPTATTTPTATPTPTATQPPADEPQYGGVLKMITIRNPVTIGYPPELVGNDALVVRGCLEYLVEFGEELGTYEPELATSWEVAPDGSSLTLHLRQGVKFHDGTDFNAEAVKWNLDNAKESGKILKTVSSIEVVDDYTIRINYEEFSNLTLFELARAEAAMIVSPTAVETNGIEWAKVNPVGTGPFKFKEYEREVSVKLERFDDYWEEGIPYLDGVEWYYVKESATREAMLKSGEAQGHQDMDYLTANALSDDFVVHSIPISQHGFFWNTSDPTNPFADKRLREAVEYAIDKVAITREVTMGYFYPVYQCVPKGILGYNSDLESQHRVYDVAKAKELLTDAGYPDGIDFKLNVMVNWEMDVITAMQANLADAGINMEIQVLDRPAMINVLAEGGLGHNEAAAYYFSWDGDTLYGINSYFPQRWTDEMVRPADMSELLKQAETTTDNAEKLRLIEDFIRQLHEEVTIVPWWGVPRNFAMHKSVHGFEIFHNNSSSHINYKKCWISK